MARPKKNNERVVMYLTETYARALRNEAGSKGKTLGEMVEELMESRVTLVRR